jgi:hypothetical protein
MGEEYSALCPVLVKLYELLRRHQYGPQNLALPLICAE